MSTILAAADIAERLVQAYEVMATISRRPGPQQPRSLALGYAHDWNDRNGWGEARNRDESAELYQRLVQQPTTAMVTDMEEALGWIDLVANERHRRALTYWARAMAGNRDFQRWCVKVERIHPETGRRRKDRAIASIIQALGRSGLPHEENAPSGLLPSGPETEEFAPMLETRVQRLSWRDDPAFKPLFSDTDADFSWADKQNRRRRRMKAKAARKQGGR